MSINIKSNKDSPVPACPVFLPYTSIDYGLDYPYSPSLGDMNLCQIA